MKKLISLFVLALLVSCNKETPTTVKSSAGVIVASEGIFPDGISTITLYNASTKEIEQDVFQRNNGHPVGSVVNQVLVDGDRTFFVVNGTGSVVVANTADMSEIKVFKNLSNVRNIVKAGPDKYYVSSWGINGLYVLNLSAGNVEDTIGTGNGPGEMLLHDNLLFVVNSGGYNTDSTMSVIDMASDKVVATVKVGDNPNSLQIDKNNNLWVLSSGIPDYLPGLPETAGTLVSFSLDSLTNALDNGTAITPQKTFVFSNMSKKPKSLRVSKDGNELFYLGDALQADVYKMKVEAAALPASALIEGEFYAMGYYPKQHEIYTADPLSFSESGDVYRYSAASGGLIDQFKGGIIPGCFGFKN